MSSETNILVLAHILFYKAFSWYIDGLVQERESEIFMNNPLQYTNWLVKMKKVFISTLCKIYVSLETFLWIFLGQKHNKTLFYQGTVKKYQIKSNLSLFKLQFLYKIHSVTFEIPHKISMG